MEDRLSYLERISREIVEALSSLRDENKKLEERISALEKALKGDLDFQKEMVRVLNSILAEIETLEEELNGRKKD